MLKWARANGARWNGSECRMAKERGHPEILQWARENGAPSGL
jgi:hypothetical protein